MTFHVGHTTHGFKDGNEPPEFAYNGTFFDSDYFPHIGYNQNIELDDPRRRREEKLGPLEEMAPRGDPTQSLYQLVFQGFGLDYLSHRSEHVRRTRSPSLPAT